MYYIKFNIFHKVKHRKYLDVSLFHLKFAEPNSK